MGPLANKISAQVRIWEDSHKEYGIPLPSFQDGEGDVFSIHQMPRHALEAREQIIDSALKLLELAAGPSRMISIALSQVQSILALKWLLHFDIFGLLQQNGSLKYQELANEANVPLSELTQALRMVMANHIFMEYEDGRVDHSSFSLALAKDKNFVHGLPFFCDTVLPASAMMVDATIRWQGFQGIKKPASFFNLNRELTVSRNLSQNDEETGYARLMSLLGNRHSLSAACAAEVVHGTIKWSSLRNGATVVNLGSCDPTSLELAELYPHLHFEVHGSHDKLHVMKEFANMKNPGLMSRMNFCSDRAQMFKEADVYLLPGVIHHQSDEEIVNIFQQIYNFMDCDTLIIIVDDSVLPGPSDESLAMDRVWQCRDMTMRQLHGSGGRTLDELQELASRATEDEIRLHDHCFLPGTTVATLIFGI
ncbi:hypothetical protein V8C35DRAFT_275808 [Trichoderma chlorosporum]